MGNNTNNPEEIRRNLYLKQTIAIAVTLIATAFIYSSAAEPGRRVPSPAQGGTAPAETEMGHDEIVNTARQATATTLPIRWNDLGKQMVSTGVIDAEAFENLYARRGGFNPEMRQLLSGTADRKIVMTEENAGVILNLLWAFGLANENRILTEGPMSDPRYKGAGNFASTGGWSLAQGSAMDHYSRHKFVALTQDQQTLVEQVAKNIYRPCCNNSTYFPDCNHGM